jgi:hypothetical protein
MECERKIKSTPAQQQTLGVLERQLKQLFTHLRDREPHDPTWTLINQYWRGRVFLGDTVNVPSYAKETGCMSIGLDSNGSKDVLPRLLGRCIMVLVKGTIAVSACAQQMRIALEAAEGLGMTVDLSCDDIKEFGLTQTKWYVDKRCGTDAFDGRRWTFEELLGRDVDSAADMFQQAYPDSHVVIRPWDMMHQAAVYDAHPTKETVVISYDAKSRKVVLPEPQISSMQIMSGVKGHCFMLPEEEGARCIGAPRTAHPEWQTKLVGKNLMDVTDSLRFNYPHALVETVPNTWGIPPVKRRDRIRVLFDPKTSRVTQIILG